MIEFKEFFKDIAITEEQVLAEVRKERSFIDLETARYIMEIALEDWPFSLDYSEKIPGEKHLLELCVSCYLHGMFVSSSLTQDTLDVLIERNKGKVVFLGDRK